MSDWFPIACLVKENCCVSLVTRILCLRALNSLKVIICSVASSKVFQQELHHCGNQKLRVMKIAGFQEGLVEK